MSSRPLPLIGAVLAIASFAITTEAAAQGRGRPKTRPVTTQPTATAAAADVNGVPAIPSFRQFGTWLDDASAPIAGESRIGLGVGYWRVSGGSQFDVPMLDLGYGVTDRLQASASVPFYRTSFDGETSRGLDDVYFSAKYSIFDPTLTESEFGLAVSPVVEVLSAGATDGRVHFAFPISVELRRQPVRVYGSAGYFTRGSLFSGAALEWATSTGVVLTGALTQSRSLKDDLELDALGIGRQRMDVMAGAAYPIAPIGAAAYMSVGRSLTSLDEGGTSLSLAAGMSFRFSPARATP